MRVRRFRLVRLRDEERGATLAIVAITLIALLGMLVLTFDLGRGVAIKRNMVNAADSAALAAAMECGFARGEASAMQAAGELIAENNAAAEMIGFELAPGAQCGAGSVADPNGKNEVTVTTSVAQEYFFAQIFGFDEGAVVATATAEWTTGVANPAPLKLEALKVDECLEGGGGSSCYIAFESDGPGSQWGWLNFPEGWPEQGGPNPADCRPQAGGTSDLDLYIGQMGATDVGPGTFLPSLWTIPIYVCAEGGFVDAAQQAIKGWIASTEGLVPRPIVYFPVVAPEDPPCPAEGCFDWYTGSNAAYPVVRFEGFIFEHLWSGKQEILDAGQQENCGFEGKKFPASVFCIELTVVDPAEDAFNSDPIVRLVD